jgi:ferredoxin--NADP+ reductase
VHRILARSDLAPDIVRFRISAPRIASVRRPGQFVIVRRADGAERIPLTIAEGDARAGTIDLVVQAVGKSTRDLVELRAGEAIRDIAGPLGHPTDLVTKGTAICVGGGVGAAVLLSIARWLHDAGVRLTIVVGARSADRLILEDDLAGLGELVVCTDDGSRGRAGLVTSALESLLSEHPVDAVYAAGPVPMMRAVAETTRPLAIPTTVSLNPIMVDGTGMCGGCRVTVGGQVRFACVDGPEFDAHQVDFDELRDRLTTYRAFELESLERLRGHACPNA